MRKGESGIQVWHFSEKQRRVLTWWCGADRDRDAIICDGAVRSGKTLAMGISFFCWAMKSFSGQQFGVCGKTISSLRRNVLQEVLPRLRSMGFRCEEKRSENLLTVRFGGRENRFYLFGGRDESSAALIQGITFAGVLLDEAALMPRSFVEQACARCSVAGSRLWFNCNPEGPQHWFYREWILKAEERNALRLHFTMEDNPSLTPRIRARYRRSYSGVFYRRFILGEWTAAKGLVYDFFRREEFCAPPPTGEAERWWVSVDYGTANPTSMGLWGKYGGVWYRVEEYYYDSRREGRQLTDAEYVQALRRLLGGRRAEKVIVDPSAASFITALRQAGFRVEQADNRVLDGIRLTSDWLKQGKIVLCEGCADCLREIELYAWEEGETGRDAPKKEHDHAMDEMRYFVMAAARGQRRQPFCAGVVERKRD
ncbi:MAG: PBSX family phage terminase large subunit [Oscillospiraceae bacterium]